MIKDINENYKQIENNLYKNCRLKFVYRTI